VEEMNPTVISTFAGCGGSSLGYKLAGFHELLAVEWEQNAVDTFRLNFPDVPVFHGDIAKLSVDECLRLAGGIKPGELDVFDGSPPCQGFSTVGKRKFDDPRNSLFKEFARLLEGLQPKVFVMENVTGMVKGAMKQAYLQIVKTLRECGYQVKGEVMNAMYYNVPQSRERVIIIGVRNDLGIEPTHPKPQTRPIPAKEVLAGCIGTRSQRINPWVPSDRSPATLCKMDAGWQALILTEAELKEAQIRQTWQSWRVLKGLEKHKHFGLVRLCADKVAPTLVKDAGNTTTGQVHPFDIRKLTIPEAKRIGSFPDDFKLIGSFHEKWARIGNSVPPNLMRAIAEHIKREILEKL
jgi:DNA (cytosine-5)-methyltransferase 1